MSKRPLRASPRAVSLVALALSLPALARCDDPPPVRSVAGESAGPPGGTASAPSVTPAPAPSSPTVTAAPLIFPGVNAPPEGSPRAPYAATSVLGGGALLAWSAPDARRPHASLVLSQSFDRAGVPITAPQLVRNQRGVVRTVVAASAAEGEALLAWATDIRGTSVASGAQRVRLDGSRVGGSFSLGIFRIQPLLPGAREPEEAPGAAPSANLTADELGLPLAVSEGGDGYVVLLRGALLPCPEGPSCRTLRAVSVDRSNNSTHGLGGIDGMSLRGPVFVLGTPRDERAWWGFAHDAQGLRRTERAPVLNGLAQDAGTTIEALWRHGSEAQALVHTREGGRLWVRLHDGNAGTAERVTGLQVRCSDGVPAVHFQGPAAPSAIPATAQGAAGLLRLGLARHGLDAVAWAGEALVAARGTSLVRARCAGPALSPFAPVPPFAPQTASSSADGGA